MRISDAQVTNIEIDTEKSFGMTNMRVQFDIASSVGEFHYDSDYRPYREIRNILSMMGLDDKLLLFDMKRLDVELDFTIVNGND